ncbi:MAG: amidase family protein [Hyphomicrobiaceae bacterium]
MVDDDALAALSARDAARLIAAGDITSEELASMCLARLATRHGETFPQLDPERVLAHARSADERRRSGLPLAPLHGVPVAITAALDAAVPAADGNHAATSGAVRASAPVAVLRAAGAVIIGSASNTASAAAAVSEGIVPAALGLETAGSLITSASRAGCFGFKPSFGLVPRSDVRLVAPSLDTIGVLARTVDDLAAVTDAIQAYDSRDVATASRFRPPLLATATMDWPLVPRFAFAPARGWAVEDSSLREAFDELIMALGQDVMTIEIEALFAHADAAADTVERFEHARHRGTSDSAAVTGRQISVEDYARGLGARDELLAVFGGVFADHGTILTHAAPITSAPTVGEPARLWSYLGLPVVSVPLLECDGKPVGVLLVGASGDDGRLLRTSRLLSENISRLS